MEHHARETHHAHRVTRATRTKAKTSKPARLAADPEVQPPPADGTTPTETGKGGNPKQSPGSGAYFLPVPPAPEKKR
ncbi:MAG TPA: hypothetical protein VN783_07945 [Thermoanaerobaculia bacterium]|nr:hypothetical protein [Thermoanaerobaculia bacterium]